MFTTLKRSLVILATFAGAMLLLLPLQALAKTPAPAQAAFPPSAENDFIGLSLNTEPAPVTDTASLTNTIGGEAPEGVATCPPLCNKTYLPIVYGPPFLFLGGQINLVQEDNRVMGLTVFGPILPGQPTNVTLDFSELQFSAEPQSVKAWVIGGSVYDGPYAEKSIPLTITETNKFPGAYKAMIVFKRDSVEIPQEFTFFYIPNGHFYESDGTEAWNLFGNMNPGNNSQSIPITPTIGNSNRLRLYVTASPNNYPQSNHCTMANIGFAAASIDLALPSTGAYHLFVEGTVYTQDQNPSNNATFDAFEILLNGNVVRRYSNKDQPIRCNPVINRQVVVDARIPLSGYSGITTLGLENHQRFDKQFATYTEINMVWIDY